MNLSISFNLESRQVTVLAVPGPMKSRKRISKHVYYLFLPPNLDSKGAKGEALPPPSFALPSQACVHTCDNEFLCSEEPWMYHSLILQRNVQKQRGKAFDWGYVISVIHSAPKLVRGWWCHTMQTHRLCLILFSLVSSALHYNILSILLLILFPNSN